MKSTKCRLVLHGSCKEINGGTFNSITAAKMWVSQCWFRPYTIIKIID